VGSLGPSIRSMLNFLQFCWLSHRHIRVIATRSTLRSAITQSCDADGKHIATFSNLQLFSRDKPPNKTQLSDAF
jgi:hypothetical protein